MLDSTRKRIIANDLFTWLLIHLILPILLPVFFVILGRIVVKAEGEWYDIFQTLFNNGIYLFVGISLLFSLFLDYDKNTTAHVFKPIIYMGIGISLLLTTFLFICSLNIFESQNAHSLKENAKINSYCLVFSALLSIYIKTKLINQKIKNSYNYV